MKKINNFNSFLNEFYKGKNKALGFSNFKESEQNEVKMYVFSDLQYHDFEMLIEDILDENLSDYNLEIEEVEDDETIQNNFETFPDNIIGEYLENRQQMNLYEIYLDLETYTKMEVLSLLQVIIDTMKDQMLLSPDIKLNGENFDPVSELRTKKKIGY